VALGVGYVGSLLRQWGLAWFDFPANRFGFPTKGTLFSSS